MYGQLKDGVLIHAPNPITVEDTTYFNPPDKVYEAAGYLPVVDTQQPEQDKGDPIYYIAHYEERDGQIIRIWEGVTPPEPVLPTYEERVVARVRMVYSVDDELALLRQRETKPEEFAAYYETVEKIKQEEREVNDNGI